MVSDLQPEELPLYRLCDEALFYVWDPVGVHRAPENRGEYEAYVPQVYELVRWGRWDELTAFLTWVLRERMGVAADESVSADAVEFLQRARAWHERDPYRR
jgi:hypothetical protein